MTIRPATAADIPALAAVVEASFTACVAPGYSAEGTMFFLLNSDDRYFTRRMAEHALIFVAEDGDGIIGMIELKDRTHIARFFVLPGHQRRGIGRQLMDAARNHCRHTVPGFTALTVHASPNAVPAYENLGFTVTDTEQTANGMRYVSMICDCA